MTFASEALKVRREPRENLPRIADGDPLELVGERTKVADEDGPSGLDLPDNFGGVDHVGGRSSGRAEGAMRDHDCSRRSRCRDYPV